MRRWRDPRMPAEDDTSREADLWRAIVLTEKEHRNLIWAALLGGSVLAWAFEGDVPEAHMAFAAAVVAALLAIHGQLCSIRVDAFRRELRDLPPRSSF